MKINWGNSILLVFALFLTVMITFIVFSLRQNTDLVSKDYYEKGANYTHQMEINTRSASFRDSIQLKIIDHQLVAQFSKSIYQRSDTMQVTFYRPSDQKLDFTTKVLVKTATQTFDQKNLIKGRYVATFAWMIGKEQYQVEKELILEN